MKKNLSFLFLLFVFCMLAPISAFAVSISIDGNYDDWTGIIPVLTDLDDQIYADIIAVYATNDNTSLYLRTQYSAPINSVSSFGIDVDCDLRTGFRIYGVGMEYGLTVWNNRAFIGDARDGGWSSSDFGYLPIAFSSDAFEVAIPWAILNSLYGETKEIYITGITDRSAIGYYEVEGTSAPVPEPTTMLLLGTGLVGIAGFGKKRKKLFAFFVIMLFLSIVPAAMATPISYNTLVSDPEKDYTAPFGILDLKSIEGAQDGDNLYFRLTLWESGYSFFESTSLLFLNVDPDSNPQTGAGGGILPGRDYIVVIKDDAYIIDGTDTEVILTGGTDLEVDISAFTAEIIIPLSDLSMYGKPITRVELATITDVSRGSMNVAPVPEPATLLLLGAGLLGLGSASRKKFKKR